MLLIVTTVVQLLLVLAVPLILFALVIHKIEKLTQRRLAERFGWRSVMWTGWLGTPIHELSHALMCKVFRHRIDDIALFEPDEQAGRLGYVRHSFRHGNTFEELGNFFIGLAPLAGGSVALCVLLWMFFPDAAWRAVEHASQSQTQNEIQQSAGVGVQIGVQGTGLLSNVVALTGALCTEVFSVKHVGSGRFWGFLYLVLCVGSHMAPSRSDYMGAKRGVWIFLLFAALVTAVATLLIKTNPQSVSVLGNWLSPLLALMLLTVVLCAISSAAVCVLTALFPVRFE